MKANIIKGIGLIWLLFCSVQAKSQFTWVKIGVDGLTCSQCTRSVELSVRKLDFVEDVKMNLKNTEGEITFKKGKVISIEKISQAVFDAGFSIRFLKAGYIFNNVRVSEGFCYSDENNTYQFTGVPDKTLDGEVALTFLGAKYLPKKEFAKRKKQLKNNCTGDKKSYYVTA